VANNAIEKVELAQAGSGGPSRQSSSWTSTSGSSLSPLS